MVQFKQLLVVGSWTRISNPSSYYWDIEISISEKQQENQKQEVIFHHFILFYPPKKEKNHKKVTSYDIHLPVMMME